MPTNRRRSTRASKKHAARHGPGRLRPRRQILEPMPGSFPDEEVSAPQATSVAALVEALELGHELDDLAEGGAAARPPHLRVLGGNAFDGDRGDRDTFVALRALYVWKRDGGFPSRAEIPDKIGSASKQTEKPLRDVIAQLGARLGVELIEQGTSPGGYWTLTEAGRRLAEVGEKLLATFDEEVTELLEAPRRDPALVRPPLHVGCFNAQVKLYLAKALGSLLADPDFGYQICFNRDMNVRTVNARVLLDDVGRDRAERGRDPGLYRYRGFHYAVVPWIDQPNPYGAYAGYAHRKLYAWKLLAVVPEDSPLRLRDTVSLQQVLDACEATSLPLLLTPPFNISRMMVDADLAAAGRVPLVSYILENPDSYTRAQLARYGHGVAVVTADTLPPRAEGDAPYPVVVDTTGRALSGFHTLTWRPFARRGAGARRPPEAAEALSPAGVSEAAHAKLCAAIDAEVAVFARHRQGVVAIGP